MADLVAPRQDETVPVRYVLNAIVVEMPLVVPFRLVYQIERLVLVQELLRIGNRLLASDVRVWVECRVLLGAGVWGLEGVIFITSLFLDVSTAAR